MSQHRVIFKPDSTSTDEFIIFTLPGMVEKWRQDKTIPLTDVVDSFQVFHSGQGAQGKLGHASKLHLENEFGTSKEVDVIIAILQSGRIEETKKAVPDRWASRNDSHGVLSSH